MGTGGESVTAAGRADDGASKTLPTRSRATVVLAILIFACSLALYSPVRRFEFITYDDADYVTNKAAVKEGLSWETIRWSFTSTDFSNWHPLMWLSLALDAQLFGLDPGWFHLHNAVLHAANAALLFVALLRMSGRRGCSLLVAALFAAHPLHVESVAWVSERKDVLSGLFMMLMLLAYAAFSAQPTLRRYALVVAALALGLMAKPMLVTAPCVLLLLDVWPLERIRTVRFGALRLLAEKLPMFLLVIGSCIVTYEAQQRGGSVISLERTSLTERFANATVSYVVYLRQAIWPTKLAPFYPYESLTFTDGRVLGSFVLLAAITAFAAWIYRRQPAWLIGWLWYLGMLVPVIGLVQVGRQAHADRYTYLPLIGVFIAVTWGLAGLAGRPATRIAIRLAAALCVALYAWRTWGQLAVWKDSETLFVHTLQTSGSTGPAHFALATHYRNVGQYEQAVRHLRATLEFQPDRAIAWSVLGYCLVRLNRAEEAGEAYSHAAPVKATTAEEFAALGNQATERGLLGAATAFYARAAQLGPQDASIRLRLAYVMWKLECPGPARRYLEEAREKNAAIVTTDPLWAQLDSVIPRG